MTAGGGHAWIEGGDLFAVQGWRGAAVRAGLKPSGGLDLALLCADAPRAAAAVFTRNELPAAPVVLGRESLEAEPSVRSIVVNAGNANALTGERGLADARAMRDEVARTCGGPALVLSTGVIGVPLPLPRVLAGIRDAADRLATACPEVADAILTTDTRRKTAALRVALPDAPEAPARTATIGGVAKGSGMIHPNMATMLAIVALDEPVEPDALRALLERAVDRSFHEITVDGDTSTNDTVLLVGGAGDRPPVRRSDPRWAVLADGVEAVMRRLALAIVEDGEGCTRVMDLRVCGARDDDQARSIARAVAGSALVKTALAGGDPNWGRIVAAAANAGVPLAAQDLALELCGETVLAGGAPRDVDRQGLARRFAAPRVAVELTVGRGAGNARCVTSDLSTEYVRINSEYTT